MTSTPKGAKRYDFSIYLTSVMDHFDSALYGFLAPMLAPLFFPDHDPMTQLILTYSVLGTSILTRPIGSLIFGNLAHRRGPNKAIHWALAGLMISLLMLSILPTHNAVGPWAPCILIVLRMIKGIFAAGESAITKLLILENKIGKNAFKASYRYQYATMVGIIAASALSALAFYYQDASPYLWRGAFFIGFAGSLIAFWLRTRHQPKAIAQEAYPPLFRLTQLMKMTLNYKGSFITIALINALSYVTYAFPFLLMNTLIPLISSVTLDQMMAMTTSLLILDLLLIPTVGRFVQRFPYQQTMILACLMLALGTPALFYGMPDNSILYIALTRMWIIFWGVVFMCPLNLCTQDLLKGSEKFLINGIASALGTSTFGRLCPAIGLYVWHTTQISWAPALYLSCVAFMALGVLAFKSFSAQSKVASSYSS